MAQEESTSCKYQAMEYVSTVGIYHLSSTSDILVVMNSLEKWSLSDLAMARKPQEDLSCTPNSKLAIKSFHLLLTTAVNASEFLRHLCYLSSSCMKSSFSVCRLGYTARCPNGALFGSPALEGGQAQYVRVPTAGGTLFNLSDSSTWSSALSKEAKEKALVGLSDSSLLMLADILPTGVFAATQAINHPKVAPVITGKPWPLCFNQTGITDSGNEVSFTDEDKILNVAIIGLGPVGVCAAVSLLDVVATRKIPYRIVAIDPIESRREKMKIVHQTIDDSGKGNGQFVVCSIDEGKEKVKEWTSGVGCTAVLEVCTMPPIRLFGVLTTCILNRLSGITVL